MPRTHWLLVAGAVLPLLVPSSAVSFPPALTATKISSAKVCGAGECREVSDPKAATALAVGPFPRFTDGPKRGLPWYKSTLKIRAEDGGKVRVSVIVVPSAGLMFSRDKSVWAMLAFSASVRIPLRLVPHILVCLRGSACSPEQHFQLQSLLLWVGRFSGLKDIISPSRRSVSDCSLQLY